MKFLKFFLIKFFFIFFFQVNSYSVVINKLEVSGNRQIQSETLLSKFQFIKGKDYSENDLNEIQKIIFDTGFFQNVNFEISNDILKINVKENPIIDFFYIYGDKNKDRIEKIYEILELKSGMLFSDYKLLNDISKISDIYKFSGYYNVKIEPIIKKVDDNKVNISIKITKNDVFKINRIFFIGKKFFNSGTLIDAIYSSENTWWKFLSSSSLLNESNIAIDKNLLKRFYLNEGYYDVQIVSAKIEIVEKNFANIIFSINSGPQYYFGNISFNQFNYFNQKNNTILIKKLKKLIRGKYSRNRILLLKDKINQFLVDNNSQNFDFDINEVKEKNKININVNFYEKKLPLVKNILITGNSITEEKVIRNNLVFSEGDFLTEYRLKKSEDNIKSIGIFKDVKISQKKIDDNLTTVLIDVIEQPTGSIMGGVGIGSNEAAVSFSITEKNLFGLNITANSEMSIGTEKITGNFLIINPDYKDSGRFVKNDFFIQETNYESVGYDSSMFGDNLSTRYQIYEDLELNIGLGFDYDKIKANSSASSIYKSQEGNFTNFKAFYGLSQDKRNRRFNTTSGHVYGFNQTIAVPGSDIPYIKNNLYAKYYHSISNDYVFNFRSGVSAINGYDNKNIKLSDRLFLTSSQLRGFEPRGVGPIDGTDHVGGNYSFYSGISSTFPNPLPEKWNAKTVAFFDAGNVWGVDYDDSSSDSNKLRSAFGIGLDWFSPLGPITFTLSNSISKLDSDNDQSFSFQIGSTF